MGSILTFTFVLLMPSGLLLADGSFGQCAEYYCVNMVLEKFLDFARNDDKTNQKLSALNIKLTQVEQLVHDYVNKTESNQARLVQLEGKWNGEWKQALQYLQTENSLLSEQNKGLEDLMIQINNTVGDQRAEIRILRAEIANLTQTLETRNNEDRQGSGLTNTAQRTCEDLNKTIINIQTSLEVYDARFTYFETVHSFQNQSRDNLREEFTSLVEKVQSTSMNWTASAPAFHVQLGQTLTIPADDTIVVFRSIKMNVNDSYNVTDGLFRAPICGRYVFSLSVRHEAGKNAFAKIMRNGTVLGWAISRKGISEAPGAMPSSSAVIDLNVNDVVYVVARNKGDRFHSITTSFMGCLLYPL